MKVGGRRLSITTRQRRNSTSDGGNPETQTPDETKADYPRPSRPGGSEVLQQDHDDDAPKKDRNQGFEHEKRLPDYLFWKGTTPTRDLHGNIRGPTQGMRIRQPAGKAFNI